MQGRTVGTVAAAHRCWRSDSNVPAIRKAAVPRSPSLSASQGTHSWTGNSTTVSTIVRRALIRAGIDSVRKRHIYSAILLRQTYSALVPRSTKLGNCSGIEVRIQPPSGGPGERRNPRESLSSMCAVGPGETCRTSRRAGRLDEGQAPHMREVAPGGGWGVGADPNASGPRLGPNDGAVSRNEAGSRARSQ